MIQSPLLQYLAQITGHEPTNRGTTQSTFDPVYLGLIEQSADEYLNHHGQDVAWDTRLLSHSQRRPGPGRAVVVLPVVPP